MKNLNQQILNFDYEQNFKDQDFYVSKSNEHSFKLLNSWPKWEKNFVNLIGENFSGKSHLINIFIQNFKGIKIPANKINNDFLKKSEPLISQSIENPNKFLLKRIDKENLLKVWRKIKTNKSHVNSNELSVIFAFVVVNRWLNNEKFN